MVEISVSVLYIGKYTNENTPTQFEKYGIGATLAFIPACQMIQLREQVQESSDVLI